MTQTTTKSGHADDPMTQTTTKQAGERTQHTPLTIDDIWQQRDELQKQRDDLLAACKALLLSREKMVSHDDYVNQFGFSQEYAIDNALAAIAKATQQ